MSSILTSPSDIALAEVDHHSFNLAVWEQLCADPAFADLDFRIETDKHGQIIMSPPPAPAHGNHQSEISRLLGNQKNSGRVISECPVSTTDGVKAADDAWCSDEVWDSLEGASCFVRCPELLVEVLSPSNTKSEIKEKKQLYFKAGAIEVWICDLEGKMTFYESEETTIDVSRLFPEFPVAL